MSEPDGEPTVKIDDVNFYYLSMPEIRDIGDGSQDVLLVRVRAGEWEGWGECEASPLVSIASLIAPKSHSACWPVLDSVLGQQLDDVADIGRIADLVRTNSFDQLQSDHTLSGIEIALWDLLGQRFEVPVHQLLGYRAAQPKLPYASALFGATPDLTYQAAVKIIADGYRAVKFGWGGFGSDLATDIEQLSAAREGIGWDVDLLVDAAMAWGEDAGPALERLPYLEKFGVLFIEEPFLPGANAAYRELRKATQRVRLAGGEGSHNLQMALNMMDEAAVDFIQIDTGRIGGIGYAKRVSDAAEARGCTYLNHTFTSHLALSASLQPYAGNATSVMCEYPVDPQPVSWDLTQNHLLPDADGMITVPDAPGLGIAISEDTIRDYLVDVEITIDGVPLYTTPTV